MIYGQTGDSFTIFASCDNVYLKDHGKGFVTSCALAKNNVHLHITNPTEDTIKYLEYLKNGYQTLNDQNLFTTSYDTIDVSTYTTKQRKTFYACNRFIVAADVIKCDVLILDIDCLVMKHVDNLECDVGLFLREDRVEKEWKGLAGKTAAGAVYCSIANLDFLNYVKEFIQSNKLDWYIDQVALYKSYLNFPDKNYIKFDNKFMDWTFKPDSIIWTGKGDRKRLNAIYTKKHNDFKRAFPIKDAA
jgi:hypothetical protein